MEYVKDIIEGLKDMTLIINVLLILFFAVFAWVFWREDRDDKSPIYWRDMLTDKDDPQKRISLTKLGQFIGIALSSWIAVSMTLRMPTEQLPTVFPWVFGTWLTFLVAQSGVKMFNAIKKSNENSDPNKEKTE